MPRGASAYYLSVNRNKKSLAADLTSPVDRELIHTLIAGADVVVDNFKRGMLARNGLDLPSILTAHPSLVWCTITGFGADSDRAGYDFVVQAEQGWMAITGETEGAPMKVGVALADVVAGKDACIAILAALVARGEETGRGRHVTVSLAASASAALVNVAQNALVSGEEPRRWGNGHPNLVPYQLFEASDRPLVIAVGNDAQWLSCARALGLHHTLANDPRLATNAGRIAERERLIATMTARIAERDPRRTGSRCSTRPAFRAESCARCSSRCATSSARPNGAWRRACRGAVRMPPPRLDEHGADIRARGWSAFDATADRCATSATRRGCSRS